MIGANVNLLATKAITAALTGYVTEPHMLGLVGADRVHYLAVEAKFVYGAGGTDCKVWVQTSLDGGITWIDIMCFAFLLATASKVSAVNTQIALAAGVTPTDGTLGDNTILNGLLGDRVRLKITTTGVYAGTTLTVAAVAR